MKVEFKNVTKLYHVERAVDNLTFSVENGDVLGLIGPNGAGKTTIIRLSAMLIKLSEGEIFVDKVPLKKAPRGKVGLLSPQAFLYSDLTVAENLKLYANLYRASSSKWNESAEYFNLTGMLDKLVRELSHGQKKRASLARLMIADPHLVLLDEPFLGLDLEATEELIQLIAKLKNDGRIVLVATHHLDIASQIITKIMILRKGTMVHFGNFNKETTSLTSLYNIMMEQ